MSALILAVVVVAVIAYGAAAPDGRTLHATRAAGAAVGLAAADGWSALTEGVRARAGAAWKREPKSRWWRITRKVMRGTAGALGATWRAGRAAGRGAARGWRAGWAYADRVEHDRAVVAAARDYDRAAQAGDAEQLARAQQRLADLGETLPTVPVADPAGTADPPGPQTAEGDAEPGPTEPARGADEAPPKGDTMADNLIGIRRTELATPQDLNVEARAVLDVLNQVANLLGAASQWAVDLPDRYATAPWGTGPIAARVTEVAETISAWDVKGEIAATEALAGLQVAISGTRTLTEQADAHRATGSADAFRTS